MRRGPRRHIHAHVHSHAISNLLNVLGQIIHAHVRVRSSEIGNVGGDQV